MRITESQLRKIVRQEARRLVEARRPRSRRTFDDAWTALSEAELAEQDEDFGTAARLEDEACKILADLFRGSPTPAQDIASELEEQGYDEDKAFEIGDRVQMKYMDEAGF
jgi:hypothetical protein